MSVILLSFGSLHVQSKIMYVRWLVFKDSVPEKKTKQLNIL